MENERRNRIRRAFELQPEGLLSLHIDGQPIDILDVQDISPFGIGLLIDSHVTNGCSVTLRYIHDRSDIQVSGSVVWTSPGESGTATRLGVYLQEEDMSQNVAFFNAITA